jgi:hypothetical protein
MHARLLRAVSAFVLVVCLTRCAKPADNPEPLPPPPKALDQAVYHPGVEAWIVPQNDPYALDNFQKAYDNLSARGAAGTRAGETLDATHYALKIFPRDEEEELAIEQMADIHISYIPFTWLGLTEDEAQELETAATRAGGERPLFTEVSSHTVSYDEVQTVGGEAEGGVSYLMPIVYAVWPVGKPLPEEWDYEMDYKVYLPSGAALTRNGESMRELEQEAIRLALGDRTTRSARTATRAEDVVLSGEFWMWESLRTARIPIPNIKVKFHLGSNIVETEADEEGHFEMMATSVPADASWDILYQNEKWKITRPGSTIPKFVFQGAVYQETYWSEENTHIRTTIQAFDAAIIKTLNYFYYGSHNFTKWEYTGGLRVIAHESSNSSHNGMFSFTSANTCYLTIYRNNVSDRNMLMGTILHEMGHFIQFKERGGYNNFKNVDRLLQESFASYVGWYLTEKYYTELGYEAGVTENISGQDRQRWVKTSKESYYSPLLVDLVDNFNQGTYYGGNYNYDTIKGTHYTIIMEIARSCTDWESCKSVLRRSESIASQGLEAFLAPYDYWYTH